jgi:hypothetical protein
MTWLEAVALGVVAGLLLVAIWQAWWIRLDLKLGRIGINGLIAALEGYGKTQSMAIDEINILKLRVELLEKQEAERPSHSWPDSPLTN